MPVLQQSDLVYLKHLVNLIQPELRDLARDIGRVVESLQPEPDFVLVEARALDDLLE